MITTHPTHWIIEIQNKEKPEGIHCAEGIEVRVEDEGGGPFLAISCRNLEPSTDYNENTVTIEASDIEPLCEALKEICEGFEDKS